jgi:hypothetical protein
MFFVLLAVRFVSRLKLMPCRQNSNRYMATDINYLIDSSAPLIYTLWLSWAMIIIFMRPGIKGLKRISQMKSSLTCLIVVLIILGLASGARAEVTSIVKIGGSAVLTRTAVVGGDVVALGGIIAMGKGADVRGTLTEINSSNVSDAISNLLSDDWEGWSWLFALFSVVVFLTTLVIAMLTVVLIPKPIITISEGITLHTYRATIAGFIGLMMIAPIAVLLTLSVIGIVLIPLQIVLVVCAAVFGLIAVAQTVGKRVLVLTKKTNDSLIRQTFWGLLILWIIGWIPYVGWMIKVLAIVLGMGGVMITRFGSKKA